MTQEMNESAQLNQELKQIIGKFKEYFGILDDLAEVQRQFEESARQLTKRQDKTEEILENVTRAQKKLEDNATDYRWEELGKKLSKLQEKLDTIELNFTEVEESQTDKLKITGERLNAFIENNKSHEKTVLGRLNAIEEKREHELEDLKIRHEEQTQIKTELSEIKKELNQFKQEQIQLHYQVSQLQSKLEQSNQERRLVLSQLDKIYGLNLEQRIHLQGPVTLEQSIKLMLRTCRVLSDIHTFNPPLIHGNIQPSNILVNKDDNLVFLLDFRRVKEIDTLSDNQIPLNNYSAPEQQQGQLLLQSDLYGIGSTLIFLLTGKNPQEFYVQRGRSDSFNLEEIATITPQLREVILRVTKLNPSDRYQTAKELMQNLAACLPR